MTLPNALKGAETALPEGEPVSFYDRYAAADAVDGTGLTLAEVEREEQERRQTDNNQRAQTR